MSQVQNGDIKIIQVDPFHAITGMLFPFVLRRMEEFAKIHYGDTLANPMRQVRTVAASLVAGVEGTLMLALVTPEGRLVGHIACMMQQDQETGKKWLFVLQAKLDEPGADAITRAIEYGENFARSYHADSIAMETKRSDSAWAKAYGFKVVRHIMIKSLNGHTPEPTPVESRAKGVEM